MGKGKTWEDCERRTVGAHDERLPNNQLKNKQASKRNPRPVPPRNLEFRSLQGTASVSASSILLQVPCSKPKPAGGAALLRHLKAVQVGPACALACVHVLMPVCTCAHRPQRTISAVVHQLPSTQFVCGRQGLSLAKQARLVGQRAPGILLPLLFQHWDCKCGLLCLAFKK